MPPASRAIQKNIPGYNPAREDVPTVVAADTAPLSRSDRAEFAGLNIEYKTDPNLRRRDRGEFARSRGKVGDPGPAQMPGGRRTRRRKTRRSLQRKSHKNRR